MYILYIVIPNEYRTAAVWTELQHHVESCFKMSTYSFNVLDTNALLFRLHKKSSVELMQIDSFKLSNKEVAKHTRMQ